MSDGQFASPPPQSAPLEPAFEDRADSVVGAEVGQADPKPLMATGPAHTMAPPASHQNLAQQMQVFLTRTDIQQSRKNRFYLQQVFELLSELDQHTARRGQLQTSLQETEAHIKRIRHSLVEIAGDSVEAENEALAIAQARAHLAGLLRDKIVQEFE
jgi:septal ring factor EnvC (AmiA/AmiB activator)